jgi:hypothetical protein
VILGIRAEFPYSRVMLRMRKKPPAPSRRWRRLEIPIWAHDAALHYLARAAEYRLDEDERAQLLQIVIGHVGRCDEAKARAGLEWMRARARRKGRHRVREVG